LDLYEIHYADVGQPEYILELYHDTAAGNIKLRNQEQIIWVKAEE
jgi:hypothetical protein